MGEQEAFVCYVHADDEADHGRILELARDLVREYEAITAESLRMVFDKAHLTWGDDWRPMLTDAVGRATFFIPFITPRFFNSTECRREFEHFQKTAASLGRTLLVLPILYIEVPDLTEDSTDPLRQLVSRTQYVDWTKLRFEERTGGGYRRAVHELASALRDRVLAMPDPVPQAVATDGDGEPSDSPGFLDVIGDGLGAVEKMTAALGQIGEQTNVIGELMAESTSQLLPSGDPRRLIANRLTVANALARRLADPVSTIEAAVVDYRSALERADLMTQAMFALGARDSNRKNVEKLAPVIVEMYGTLREAFSNSDGFIDSLREIENFTRVLRNPTQRLRRALQSLRDTEPTVAAWADDATALLTELDSRTPQSAAHN